MRAFGIETGAQKKARLLVVVNRDTEIHPALDKTSSVLSIDTTCCFFTQHLGGGVDRVAAPYAGVVGSYPTEKE